MDLRALEDALHQKTEFFDKAVEAGTPTSELLEIYKEIKILKHDILLQCNPSYVSTLGRSHIRVNAHPSQDVIRQDNSQVSEVSETESL